MTNSAESNAPLRHRRATLRSALSTSRLILARALGLAVVPGLGAVAPLLVLPVISRSYGPNGWASIAVGQAIGMTVAVVVEAGWALTGPSRVAVAGMDGRRALFLSSLRLRRALFLYLAPAAGVAAAAVAHSAPLAAALTAAAFTASGVNSSWYFIGAGQARSLIVFDALPKAAVTLAGGAAVFGGLPILCYPLFPLIGYELATRMTTHNITGSWREPQSILGVGATWSDAWAARGAILSRSANAAYMGLPLVFVALVGSSVALSNFAAADRLGKYAFVALVPLTQAMQSWVPNIDALEQRRRTRLALALTALVAGLTWLALTPLYDSLIGLLFGSRFTITATESLLFAVSVAIGLLLNGFANICLAPLGRVDHIAKTTIAGVLALGPLVALGYQLFGVSGAVGGVDLAGALILGLQAPTVCGAISGRTPREGMRATSRVDSAMTVVFASHTPPLGDFRVGSHHLSGQLARRGHLVVHVATPATLFHLGNFDDLNIRRRLRASLGRTHVVDGNGVVHVYSAALWPLRWRRSASALSLRTAAPRLAMDIRKVAGDEPDFLIVDQADFAGLDVLLRPRRIVFRPTDRPIDTQQVRNFGYWAERADVVVATSESVAESVSAWIRPENVEVLPNGVDLAHFQRVQEPSLPLPDGRQGVIYVGALDNRLDLEMVSLLAERMPDVPFVIAGPGGARLSLRPPNVTCRGPVQYDRLPELLSQFRIGLLPFSGADVNKGRSPMKYFEYLIAGLNVVGRRSVTLQAQAAPGVWLYDDLEQATKALVSALACEENLAGAEAARQQGWDMKAERFEKILKSVSAVEAGSAR